ncbi:MAG: Peptidase family [Chitinophagaceae bacterium]|nr:Peptidase family [Chitinophagaceae bacterium]
MKINCLVAALLFVLSGVSKGQQRIITCTSERNPDGSIGIYADSKAFAEYTLKLNFKELNGYTSSALNGVGITINRGKTQIAKLTQDKNSLSYSFNYTYQYFPGRSLSRPPDTTFTYLLPSTSGNTLRVVGVSSLQERILQTSSEDFHGVGFWYKQGDTICAARAGIVFESIADQKTGEKFTQVYNASRNKIGVAHNDGTLAYYTILAPVKLLVEPGDKVVPGQPMAVFFTESDKYHVLFSVYYLDDKKVRTSAINNGKPFSVYTGVPTLFYNGESENPSSLQANKNYKVLFTNDIVTRELTKKEKKRLGFN